MAWRGDERGEVGTCELAGRGGLTVRASQERRSVTPSESYTQRRAAKRPTPPHPSPRPASHTPAAPTLLSTLLSAPLALTTSTVASGRVALLTPLRCDTAAESLDLRPLILESAAAPQHARSASWPARCNASVQFLVLRVELRSLRGRCQALPRAILPRFRFRKQRPDETSESESESEVGFRRLVEERVGKAGQDRAEGEPGAEPC